MRKQKFTKLIALILFLFYLFFAIISLIYTPPKHNYTKADIIKIKEQNIAKEEQKLKQQQQQQQQQQQKIEEPSINLNQEQQEIIIDVQKLEYQELKLQIDQSDVDIGESELETEQSEEQTVKTNVEIEESEVESDQFRISEEDVSFMNFNSSLEDQEEFDFFEEIFVYELPEYNESSISDSSQNVTDNVNINDQVIINETLYIWEHYFTLSFHLLDDLYYNKQGIENEQNYNMLWKSYFWQCQLEEYIGQYIHQQEQDNKQIFDNQVWKEYFYLKCNPLDYEQIVPQQTIYMSLWKQYFYYNYHKNDNFVITKHNQIILSNQIWREYFQLQCNQMDQTNEITNQDNQIQYQDNYSNYSDLYKQYFLQCCSNLDGVVELSYQNEDISIIYIDDILIQLPILIIIMLIIFDQNINRGKNQQKILYGNLIAFNESFSLLIQNQKIVNRLIEQSQEQLQMQIEQFYCIYQ